MEEYHEEVLVHAAEDESGATSLTSTSASKVLQLKRGQKPSLPYTVRSYGLGLSKGAGFLIHHAIIELANEGPNDAETVLRGNHSPQRQKLRKRHYMAPSDFNDWNNNRLNYARTLWPGKELKFFACAENCTSIRAWGTGEGRVEDSWGEASEVIFVPMKHVDVDDSDERVKE